MPYTFPDRSFFFEKQKGTTPIRSFPGIFSSLILYYIPVQPS